MPQFPTSSGDTLLSLAQRHLGDFRQWRALADLNNLNPLEGLPIGVNLNIPGKDELFKEAQPILSGVALGLNGLQGRVAATLRQLEGQASGYVKEAEALLGEVNGVFGEVESVAQKGMGDLSNRNYKGEAVKLIDWLLQ